MDGRVQVPVHDWLVKEFGFDYVDAVTEAGPTKVVTQGEPHQVRSVRERVRISVEKHGSPVVALVAHGDCAGNPLPKDESIRQLEEGMEVVRSWGFGVTVIGLWVDDADWHVELVGKLDPGS